jgi:hypothetical protein
LWENNEGMPSSTKIGKHEGSSSVEGILVLLQAGLRNILNHSNVESVLSSSNEERFFFHT